MFGLMKKPSQKQSNQQETKAWPRRNLSHSKSARYEERDYYPYDEQRNSRRFRPDQERLRRRHYEDLEDKILEVVMAVVNSPRKRSIKRQSLDAGNDKPLPISQGSKGKNKSLVLENIADQSCLCLGKEPLSKELLDDAENINEESKGEVLEELPFPKSSTVLNQAKSSLTSSSNFVLKSKPPCDELTSLKLVQPSRHVSCSQVLEESSQEEEPKEAQPVYVLEQPTTLVLQPTINSFLGENPNKLCKESNLFDANPSLFVLVIQQDENYFGLAKVKEFYVPGFIFDKMIQPFKTLEHEKFFEPKCLMFDEFRDLDYCLKGSLENKSFRIIRAEENSAFVKTFSKFIQCFENVLNPFNKNALNGCKTLGKYHVLDKSFPENTKIISFSKASLFALRSLKDFFDYFFCTFDVVCLVFLQAHGKQVKEMTSQLQVWNWKYLRKDASKIQGSFILIFFFLIVYLFVSLNIFCVLNLFPFDVGELDLRSNPFQEGGDDMILTSSSLKSSNQSRSIMEPRIGPAECIYNSAIGGDFIRPTSYEEHLGQVGLPMDRAGIGVGPAQDVLGQNGLSYPVWPVLESKLKHEDLSFFQSGQDDFSQPSDYYEHFGRAKSDMAHGESRDGRDRLILGHIGLTRPPDHLQAALHVFDDPMHYSVLSKSSLHAKWTKEEIGHELDQVTQGEWSLGRKKRKMDKPICLLKIHFDQALRKHISWPITIHRRPIE